MKKMLNILPFDKYYCNCFTNAVLSIITAYDKSYVSAGYTNEFLFSFGSYPDQYFPYIDMQPDFFTPITDNLVISPGNYKELIHCVEEIKENILNNYYFFAGLDLFYWDRTGTVKGLEHLSHYSLIAGFDEGRKEIYALEDNIGTDVTYSIQTYSEEELLTAVTSEKNDYLKKEEPNFYTVQVKENILPYRINPETIKKNSEKIVKFMENDKFTDFSVHNDDFTGRILPYEYIRVHTKYENREKANRYLFEELAKAGILSGEQYENLKKLCDEIISNVNFVKLKLLKQILSENPKPINPRIIEERWKRVFDMDHTIWNDIIKIL